MRANHPLAPCSGIAFEKNVLYLCEKKRYGNLGNNQSICQCRLLLGGLRGYHPLGDCFRIGCTTGCSPRVDEEKVKKDGAGYCFIGKRFVPLHHHKFLRVYNFSGSAVNAQPDFFFLRGVLFFCKKSHIFAYIIMTGSGTDTPFSGCQYVDVS